MATHCSWTCREPRLTSCSHMRSRSGCRCIHHSMTRMPGKFAHFAGLTYCCYTHCEEKNALDCTISRRKNSTLLLRRFNPLPRPCFFNGQTSKWHNSYVAPPQRKFWLCLWLQCMGPERCVRVINGTRKFDLSSTHIFHDELHSG